MSKSKRIKTGCSLAVFLMLVLVGAAASPKAEMVDVTITANKPDYVVIYPSGCACYGFDLQIEGWFGKQHIKEFKDKNGLLVRALSAGTGAALRYTNLTTGQTFSSKSNGAVSHTTYNPDGSLTLKLTGHNVVVLLPTDIPPGPSTTMYEGRVVISIDTSGNYTMQEESGNKTDICAAVSYCTGCKDLAIMAHADDDFYFAADQIKPNIAAGHSFRVVHLTGGDAARSDYQKRVNAALAGYERMLGLKSPPWTETWDEVNDKPVHRYQTVLTWRAGVPLQTLEVQVVGLPCGWYDRGGSGMGVSLGELVNDADIRATTINGKYTSYNLAEVRAFLEQIFTWEQPSTIFTLDPYGHFFYNGHEGQHPDHILTARLVQESGYVASHPTMVKYFKTYNLNDLPANLDSPAIIAKNEAMLGYVSVDPGPFTLGEGATDCSRLSISRQLGDDGWLCKDYAARDGTYFQAAQLKLDDGRCLAVRKSDGNVTFATCTDTAYATDFSLDGQGQVFVGNATGRRLGTTLSAGSAVTAPLYDTNPSGITVTQWRYNPTSKTLQQTNPSNAQLICVAPSGTGVAMVDCGSGAALTVTRGAAAPTGVPLTIKNKVYGRCVLISEAGAVSMGDCASSDARLELNAAGQLASAANPSQCLQRKDFQQKSYYVGAPCNSASFGQQFALTRVASGTDYTFVSHTPATCMEDLGGLSGEGCHNYEHQLWVVTDASAWKSPKTDFPIRSRR